MNGFAWALALFVLIHVGLSATGLRAKLVGRIGEGPYRGFFALASLALLAWMIQGFAAMRDDPFDALNEAVWAPPLWLHWPGLVISLLGVALAITGVLTPGPTYAGFETSSLKRPDPAHGILRISRHPFLWGVALWSLGHLLVNGERFALMLFGALGLMVVFGARSIDRKARARNAEGWDAFEDVTSNVPFAAIAQGRNRLALGEIGWRGLAGLAVAFAIAWAHGWLFGFSVL
ncbi:NnrU family protein [Terricaulis sp.]|uniref:NnrU family protein n=1 Tax=Terricaulis sp. TaxID=2768686 RepID=UPI002AC4696B|nr:NnrU family protein [Terricaulis sp.]MDZ4690087.1 NnrU family protein [Terricaulis sp.]